ncbi:MAG: hypothetical protein R3A47_02350 [Polyangiales bacterium]
MSHNRVATDRSLASAPFRLVIEPLREPTSAICVVRDGDSVSVRPATLDSETSWIAVDSANPLDALRTTDPEMTGCDVIHRVRTDTGLKTVDLFPFNWDGFAFVDEAREALQAPLMNVHFTLDLSLLHIPGGGAARFGVRVDNGFPCEFFPIVENEPCDCTLAIDWVRLVALGEGQILFSELIDGNSSIGGNKTALAYFAGLLTLPEFAQSLGKFASSSSGDLVLALGAYDDVAREMENLRRAHVD